MEPIELLASIIIWVLGICILLLLMLVSIPGLVEPNFYSVQEYCNTSALKVKIMPQPSPWIEIIVAGFALLAFVICSLIRNKDGNINLKKVGRAVFKECCLVVLHFSTLCVFIEGVSIIAGVPSPYFFNDKIIEEYYCMKNGNYTAVSEIISKNPNILKSFPSFRCAVWTYCSIFIYLYIDHCYMRPFPHVAQHFIITAIGGICFHRFFNMYENNEHYIFDILVGAVLGVAQAVITIWGIMGKTFSSHSEVLPNSNNDVPSSDDSLEPPAENQHGGGIHNEYAEERLPSYESAMNIAAL